MEVQGEAAAAAVLLDREESDPEDGDDSLDRDESDEEDDSLDREESDVEDEEDEEGEEDEDGDEDEDGEGLEPSGFLLPSDGDPSSIQGIPPDAQARLEAFFEAAVGFTDGKLMSDPENLRKLTLTVSSALGEASAAINRMRDSQRKSLEEGRNDSMEEGDSLLALACSSGYFELARVLLAMGANVDDRGSKGDLTPLMDAASQGHVEIVKLLISHGAEVNAQSACGNSPLMYAAAAGHEDIVKELLKAGARVEDNNENGHTPLMEAASSGHVGVAKILLENGAGINTSSNEFKESALTVACYKGHLEMVRFLLAAGADQQHKTDEMHTALMEASMDGHVEVAKLLLDCGAQVNMPVDSFESPLTLAACGGHVELAELLIGRGANIEEVNDEGYTPLMEAAREGHIQVVKCLIKAGAKVNAKTEETQETALTLSACGGFLDVVDTLVEGGADIELGASTPLMEASQEGHYQIVKYLLEKQAKIGKQTQTGDTALSYACENGHADAVQLLIERGADPEHLSEGGRTPLMKACRGGHVEVIKYLLTKSVNVNRQTASNDHTPLSLACAGGHLAAVEVLLVAGANVYHKLKDNSTMIIEAARGGHTSVIRALLNHQGKDKDAQDLHKTTPAKGATAQTKGQAVDSSKPKTLAGAGGGTTASNQQQGKSVLRKSRSTSTLDSSQANPKTQKVEATTSSTNTNTASSGDAKSSKMPSNIMTSIPADSPLLKNLSQPLPLGDGKVTSTSSTSIKVAEETRKKPVPQVQPQPAAVALKQQQAVAAQQQAEKTLKQPTTSSNNQSQNQSNVCVECNSSNNNTSASPAPAAKTPEQPHPVTKRAADSASASASVSSNVPLTPSSTTTSPTGPPLVPSQVTAATAISERPKAKANKPSARKQVQLQQQIQQQLQHQQSQSQPSGTSANGGALVGVAQNVAIKIPAPPNPSSPSVFLPGIPTQMLQMQVQQIFTHHQQSQLIYKAGNQKYDCFEGGTITYDSPEMMAADFAQVIAASTYPPHSQGGLTPTQVVIPSSPGTTTTTTTTTVVVTHGNGETETIIEGDNLSRGTNEMIMSAAAAAFPLDCYSPGVQVQSYQLSSPLNVGDMPPLTTTTMHTTTIINSGNGNFPPQILLPHHPPALPIAFSEAAAAVGLVAPSGAQPIDIPGTLKQIEVTAALKQQQQLQNQQKQSQQVHHQQPQSKVAGKVAQVQTQTPQPIVKEKVPSSPVPPKATQPPLNPAALPKKQTAKRTRPFSQGPQGHHGPCPNNHKGCGQSHQTSSTQTSNPNDPKAPKALDLDSATESNGETSLSIAAGQGHYDVVAFLLEKKAHIEHRDKKGCTPLILASDGGHDKVVELLIASSADIEAQSERTKDTALSLACTKGRYEVVELLLKKGANKEHRNVSDYTPLSLAASGGFVNIIKLLLQSGAEINSRTGSKLGISPLMLAAMNGNAAAVKLLLDMGSDINAQIETNKNTALTLACFQGRHEVVQLLLDRKANLEHRAKTGLTPLMEAANGGYVEVGKVLIEKGADVNAPPVPATRDTALTIAADKGHFRFVEMLIACNAHVEVRNKKGCTPVWLACNGGHLDVCQALQRARSDVDAQDNRRISCLMAAFRKGHVKVVRWIVKFVKQFPNDSEMSRYFLAVASEPELLKRSQQCMEYIKQAKDKQALEASKNANILLEELELEKCREESKKLAAAKRREKKKKKKQEKKQVNPQDDDQEADNEDDDDNDDDGDDGIDLVVELMDSGVDLNSLGSNSSSLDKKQKGQKPNKGNKENVQIPLPIPEPLPLPKKLPSSVKGKGVQEPVESTVESKEIESTSNQKKENPKKKKSRDKVAKSASSDIVVEPIPPTPVLPPTATTFVEPPVKSPPIEKDHSASKSKPYGKHEKEILREKVKEVDELRSKHKERKNKDNAEEKKNLKIDESPVQFSLNPKSVNTISSKKGKTEQSLYQGPEPLMNISLNPPHPSSRKAVFEHEAHTHTPTAATTLVPTTQPPTKSPGQATKPLGRKDDGWKEVTRSCPSSRSKKVIVPSSVISRVIGRGGCNINAIREATNAHIEVEKQQKGQVQPERTIQIKGTAEATKQAYSLITALMNEPDVDIKKLIPQHMRILAATAAAMNGASMPTTILGVNPFPIIGSASTPLPPIGQPMPSSAPVEVKYKGSPTPKVGTSSVSPPLSYLIKSGSPPIKKPIVVTQNAANFEIGNFSVSEVPAEIYSKSSSYIGKKSMIFTNSGNNNNNNNNVITTSSYKADNSANQNWGEIKPRNATPTASLNEMKQIPFNSGSTAVPCGSPPLNQNQQRQQLHLQNQVQAQVQQQQQHQHLPVGPTKEADVNQYNSGGSTNLNLNGSNNSNVQQSSGESFKAAPPRNLAPGPQPIGSNRSTAGSERSSSEASNQDQQQQNPPPLEYSPFNYTFSKTTGWFPGDLAVREPSSQNQNANNYGLGAVNNLISSLAAGGSTSALSVARAMNFASVAASGITSSMSTTTAQMTQAGQNGGISAIGKPLDSISHHLPIQNQSLHDQDQKADASKAPGYRGNTLMSSPVMRMPHQGLSNLHGSGGFNMESSMPQMNHSLAGVNPNNVLNYNSRPYSGLGGSGQFPQQDMGLINSQQQQPPPVNGGNHMMFQNNRLNPRAPTFMVKVQPGQQQPNLPVTSHQQQQHVPVNSAFASTQPQQQQQQQQQSYMQQFKGLQGLPYGNQQPSQQPSRRLPNNSTWNGYVNGGLDDIGFQGLTGLSGQGGIMDPSTLGMDNIHDNQSSMKVDERRLPRPIGGERSWKGSSSNSTMGGGNIPFNSMEGPEPPSPATNWLGMYNTSGQQGFGSSGNQGIPQQQRGGDRGGNILSRRYMEDLDASNRLLELQQQQMYDGQQRLINGGNMPPMMHMQNSLQQQQQPHPNAGGMFPYGMEQVDQPHNMQKLEQQWGETTHLMDDKHMQQGWGGKWGN